MLAALTAWVVLTISIELTAFTVFIVLTEAIVLTLFPLSDLFGRLDVLIMLIPHWPRRGKWNNNASIDRIETKSGRSAAQLRLVDIRVRVIMKSVQRVPKIIRHMTVFATLHAVSCRHLGASSYWITPIVGVHPYLHDTCRVGARLCLIVVSVSF